MERKNINIEFNKLLLSVFMIPAVTFCSDGKENGTGPTVSLFNLESEHFFDVPFPSEVRRNEDGSIDLAKFPNPRSAAWIRNLIEAVEKDIKGFGTNSAIYFRFSSAIDAGSLPLTPRLSRNLISSVALINVDEESPGYGETVPFYSFYREEEGFQWRPHTLAILPAQGFVLDGDTLYCAIVTTGLKDINGEDIAPDAGFTTLIDNSPDSGPLYSDMEKLHRQAMGSLEDIGIARETVINMALFRTMDPLAEMRLVVRKIYDEVDDPAVEDISLTGETDKYWLFEGHYGPNPVFQHGWSEGLFPYETEGGYFVFDEEGRPLIDGEETMMFALSIPKTPMPVPNGYPVLLYAHGTGGDYKTFIRNHTAERMGELGISVLGIDNSMNGTRIPEESSPEMLFFNIDNIRAGRDNNRQAAADVIQLERLAETLTIAADLAPEGEELWLDGSKIMFMGHSQGGLNGSLYLALSERCRGAYLSGSAGNILYSITYKTSPVNILAGVGLIIGLTAGDIDNFDFGIYHPLINLMQIFIDPSDPINYAEYWFHRTYEAVPKKHILQSEGMGDTYTPPIGIEALGVAGELVPVLPVIESVEGFELKGKLAVEKPVRNNITTSGGNVTAGFLQYTPSPDEDGHFVSFNNEDAIATWTWFLHTLANSGEPEIM